MGCEYSYEMVMSPNTEIAFCGLMPLPVMSISITMTTSVNSSVSMICT